MDESEAVLGATGRGLLRRAETASLATLDESGEPFSSLVLVATAPDATPVIFISALALHTKNLKRHPTCSLMVEETDGLEDPMTGSRLSVKAAATAVTDSHLKARFLRRHPTAELYAALPDFSIFALAPESGYLVEGYGRINGMAGAALLLDKKAVATLAEAEADIVEHMNEDHADALDLYATRLLGAAESGWRMTGIDPEGVDMRRGRAVLRLPFEAPIRNAGEARKALVDLVGKARNAA